MFDNVKKETGAPTAVPPNGDDALFEALGTNKKSLRQRYPKKSRHSAKIWTSSAVIPFLRICS